MKPSKRPVEVIVFDDPEKRGKKNDDKYAQSEDHSSKKVQHPKRSQLSGPSTSGASDDRPVFNQKRAKHEIRKLGIHGMDKKDKGQAMVDLLVELGAKPPRKKCYHIQKYQRMMKKKKEEEQEKEMLERQAGVKKKKRRERRQRDKDDILDFVDGQTGFYKGGVQFVKGLTKK